MGAEIRDWYRGSLYRGDSLLVRGVWTTGSTPSITLTPGVGKVARVTDLIIMMSDDLDISPNTLDLSDWGGAAVSLASILEVTAVSTESEGRIIDGNNYHWCKIHFHPFLVLVQADGDTFTVSNSGGETAAMPNGSLYITIVGHEVAAADD